MSWDRHNIVDQIEPLRRFARVLTRNGPQADDLVQATLLRAHERRGLFRDGSDIRVWLMSILRNIFIDEIRNARAGQAREQAWSDLQPGFAAPSAEMATRLSELRAAFLTLPKEQREALHLVAVEGFGISEAAVILGIPAGTVMSRVGRAREALRDMDARGDAPATKPNSPSHLKIVG